MKFISVLTLLACCILCILTASTAFAAIATPPSPPSSQPAPSTVTSGLVLFENNTALNTYYDLDQSPTHALIYVYNGAAGWRHKLLSGAYYREYNGINEWQAVSPNEGTNLTKALTIECMVRPFNVSQNLFFVSKESASTISYAFYYSPAGKLVFDTTSVAGKVRQTYPCQLKNNEWYQVGVTWDQATGQTYFYVNGLQHAANGTVQNGELKTVPNGVFLMKDIRNPMVYYKGDVLYTKIYDRSLSAGEMKKEYTSAMALLI